MRRLIVLIVAAAALWGGYWFIAARGLETGLRNWLATPQVGWATEYADLNVRGFPNRLDTVIEKPVVTTDSGIAWRAPFFQAMALSYKPNHVILVWPDQQTVETPFGTANITTNDMRGSIVFSASTDLALDHSNFVIDGLRAAISESGEFTAKSALFATRLAPARTNVHEIGLDASDITPPADILAQLGLGRAAPAVIEQLKLDAALGFDRPLDRFALEGTPAQINRIELKHTRVQWGDMALRANGDLDVDRAGNLDGSITLGITNWKQVLTLAVNGGLIPQRQAKQIERGLALLSANRDTLELPLNLRGGVMSLGPIPLGPAPRLRQRQ
ncbi:DUF2125 domain-containing protein [Actibacterium lipolyticum]|uniref:DUF2125 domain-containing protein n=1 Tax=Actibacterium lipolyticum TaxID=1524263 RepID=A0A238JMG8_9RHOB|nr:DUF2125 domain-containing protein [Actibacterium lipolyticum]SMX31623.1 hypothetical protein COL8621_00543 [Actibacterium lipolyticum]